MLNRTAGFFEYDGMMSGGRSWERSEMIANGQFAAEMLSASAHGLASITADRLISRRPQVLARYGADARSAWRDSTLTRIGYLVAAMSTGTLAVLAEQLSWARTAHEARGGPEAAADFDEAMRLLAQVLREELPGDPGTLAAQYVELGLAPQKMPRNEAVLATPQRRLVADFLLSILEGDRRKASRIVLDAVQPRGDRPALTVRQVYLDVLIPAQIELGRMWHINEIGVAEEHFATATTQLIMSQLYSHLPQGPSNGKVVVAASVEGNAHDVGVRMLADLLESEGWRAVYLGASVPGGDLASSVDRYRADLVALSAGLGSQLPALASAIESIRSLPQPVKVLVGGGAFLGVDPRAAGGEDPLWRRIGADGFAADLDAAVAQAGRLVGLTA